jgi:hypothetical protein
MEVANWFEARRKVSEGAAAKAQRVTAPCPGSTPPDTSRVTKAARQRHEAATTRSVRACISRSTSDPVAATRCPRWSSSFNVPLSSTSSTEADRFIRNPDLQLRAAGALMPDVFFRRYVGLSNSRHPSTVTAAASFAGVVDPAAAATDVAAFGRSVVFIEAAAGFFSIKAGVVCGLAVVAVVDRAGATAVIVFVSTLAVTRDCCVDATGGCEGAAFASSRRAGWRAASNAAAPSRHTTPTMTNRLAVAHENLSASLSLSACFTRADRISGFALLARSAIFLNESRCSFRSALSMYLTDRAGFLVLLTGTAILLVKRSGAVTVSEQSRCPARNVMPARNPLCLPSSAAESVTMAAVDDGGTANPVIARQMLIIARVADTNHGEAFLVSTWRSHSATRAFDPAAD